MQDDFYLRFEERFRGAPEEIKQRLSAYLPTTVQVQALYPNGLAIDVGCGRGEWLELMQSQGFEVLGIDTNADMVASCHAKGLNAECADAFEKLATFESESVALVSGFHIAEHLPFDTLMGLMKEAHRVLKPGGLLILETPNPENLNVGLWTFYMDPTHRHPIPPLLLQFLGEEAGFAENRILKLNGPEKPEADSSPLSRVAWSLSAHPDYGLIAQKQATEQQAALLGQLKRNDLEMPLQQINQELEQLQQEWEQLQHANHALSEQKNALEAHLTQKLQEEHQRVEMLESQHQVLEKHYQATRQELHETQSRLHDAQSQFHKLELQASDIYHQLLATHASFSWRITEPLRRSRSMIQNAPAKAKRAVIKALRLAVKIAIRIPVLRALAYKALDRIPKLRRLKDTLQGTPAGSHAAAPAPHYQSEQRTRISRDIANRLGSNQEKGQEGDQ